MKLMNMKNPLLLVFLLALQAPGGLAFADTDTTTRAGIEAELAAHPNDAQLQEAGANALAALEAWQAELERRLDEATPPGETPRSAGVPGNGAGDVPPRLFPNALSSLDSWNINENYVSFAIADADWSINEEFPGTKFLLTGQYSFRRGPGQSVELDCDCPPPPTPYRMVGTVGAHLQFGEGESDLEYAVFGFTGVSYQRNFPLTTNEFAPLRDNLEWGVVRGGWDDPLGVDSYVAVNIARVSRTWYWMPETANWLLTGGLGLSGGFAWADSLNPIYDDVSNPIIGSWVTMAAAHPRWGKVYVEQRVINGFTLSSPSAGGSISREARFRFGIISRPWGCMTAELFVDKRSFNFSDHRLDDLYTKSRRIGLEMGCNW